MRLLYPQRWIKMYGNYKDIEVLEGKTISKIEQSEDNEVLTFYTSDGEVYKMYHMQDCCESVWLEEVIGDLTHLVGKKILRAKEVTNQDEGDRLGEYDESYTWTFYHLTSEDGDDVTLRWYGTSNGYYSESVDFVLVE